MFTDLKFATRLLLKSPGFTLVAVLALALGIATATTMFTFFNALLVRPLPFLRDEGTLVKIQTYNLKTPQDDFECSVPDFKDLRSQMQSLAGAFTLWNRTYILSGNERPDRALGTWITADAFQILGVQPALGRLFRLEEGRPGAPEVAILSYALWQKSFGGTADIIGQVVTLNAKPVTIIGVMPDGFAFPDNNALWQPFPDDEQSNESERGSHGWAVYARIKPGVTLQQVQAELDTLGARLAHDHPNSNVNLSFRALLIRDEATRHERQALMLMMGAVLAVLLIACGNVANLLLARAATRSREIALRIALGAGRGRIIRQVLTESLLLGTLGGLTGLVLTFWETDFALSFIPVEIPFWIRFDTDWRILSFALAATVGASVLFGLFPALQASRPDLTHELKDGGRAATGSGRAQRLRSALVVAQISLALVLLVIAGLMTRSFLHLQNTDTGIDANQVLTFRAGIPPTIEKDEKVALKFFEGSEQRLRETPGVESAGWMSYLPVSQNSNDNSFAVEGRPEPKPGDRPLSLVRSASPAVFSVLHIPLLRGRLFDAHDRDDQPLVALVDEVFAKKFFPNEDPLGRRFTFDDEDSHDGKRKWITIVGIIGGIMQHPTAREAEPNIWVPLAQHPDNFMSAVVRVQGDPKSFVRAAQDAVFATRADIPIYSPDPMTTVARKAMWSQHFFGGLMAGFAGLALFLAAIGIYGVMAYSVAQRTQEIGVRMALGAQPGTIVSMVLGHGAKLVSLGLVIGFIGAWFVAQLLSGLLFGVSPHDPPTFAAVPLLLAAVAFLACWLPSRRATLIDPLVALRAE
jgi:putative ABC transport system permease protein